MADRGGSRGRTDISERRENCRSFSCSCRRVIMIMMMVMLLMMLMMLMMMMMMMLYEDL